MTYNEVVDAISTYYNTSASNVWNVINDYNLSPEQAFELIPNAENYFNSGYGTVNFANGSTASWNNYVQLPIESGGNPLDSNAGVLTQTQYQLPTSSDYSGGNNTFNGGQQLTGVPQGKIPVMTQIATGIAAAGMGIQLGKVISQTAYDNGFNWLSWAGVNIESLDPATWDSITVDMSDTGFEGILKRAFNAIFTVNENESQMYIDEKAAAYLAMYMDKAGFFSQSSDYVTLDKSKISDPTQLNYPNFDYSTLEFSPPNTLIATWDDSYYISGGYTACFKQSPSESNQLYSPYSFNTVPYTMEKDGSTFNSSIYRNHDIEYSYSSGFVAFSQYWDIYAPKIPYNYDVLRDVGGHMWDCAYIWNNGGAVLPQPTIEGIGNQDGATMPDFTTALTPDDYLNLLRTQYPDLFNNAITQNVAQPDGTTIPHTYIPVGTPTATSTSDNAPTTNPNINGQSQAAPTVNPTTAPNPLIDGLVNIITNLTSPTTPPPTSPVDTGTGDTPTPIIPTGSASALYSIYNPTQGELNSFGAWLWSSNFVDQLLKLFNDPMQAIIGLHKVFAPPVISGTDTIKVGYLDSGVSSNVVGNQYTTIDCGSVDVSEYFGNVFDYDPFTQIYIYLPFVGIEKLDTGDVMRGRVGVKYHVDVITGACLAEISVVRDGAGGILYTFAGNCAVQYPISSGSYMGIVASLASIAGGVVGTVASGGALAPVAMGAVSGVLNAHTRVQHSGAFSGNAGAMGVKIPYLVITRPQTCLADNFPAFDGYPANKTTTLSACSGFVKCETCHVENIPATDAELSEIEMLLKGGIII